MRRSPYGENPKAVIVGPSTANVRIERLWLTLGTQKIAAWRVLFESMELTMGLDVNNDIHIWCLHFVFLPRLNRELEQWRNRMNNTRHTADRAAGRRRTPQEMFTHGLRELRANPELEREMRRREETIAESMYGVSEVRSSRFVEDDSRYPHARDERDADANQHEHIIWPSCVEIGLTDPQLENIRQNFDPLADDGHEGRATWLALTGYVTELLTS